MITQPKLPPCAGYVEVEQDGERCYRNVQTGEIFKPEWMEPPTSPPTPDQINAQAIAELSAVIAQNQSVTADAIAELTVILAGGTT